MKKVLFLFSLTLSVKAFALYGNKVVNSSHSFVGELQTDSIRCAGVLITPNKILTAGHCIDVMGREDYGYSHALVYHPELLKIRFGMRVYQAHMISYAPSYFEGIGMNTQDLALIELFTPVKDATPIKRAQMSDFSKDMPVTLIAHNKQVESSLISKTTYPETTVLWLNKDAGACRGDSGGAVVIKKNGEPRLAGILMFNGSGECPKQKGYAHFPTTDF